MRCVFALQRLRGSPLQALSLLEAGRWLALDLHPVAGGRAGPLSLDLPGLGDGAAVELGIDTFAVNWPIGCGKEFQGVYDRMGSRILFFSSEGHGRKAAATQVRTACDRPRCPAGTCRSRPA